MPKKLNFLGGQQNYDESNGQYLPNLVGGDGEIFTGKKEPTKLGKGVDKMVEESKSEDIYKKGTKLKTKDGKTVIVSKDANPMFEDVVAHYEGDNTDIWFQKKDLVSEENSQNSNVEEYTKEELIKKFGTDNLDIINAGNEKEIKLKQEEKQLTPDDFYYDDFEKKIPHNMRYKQADFKDDGVLYWVTQESYSDEDLETFKNELAKYGIDKAYVIVRDDSTYDYDEDLASGKGHLLNTKEGSVNSPEKKEKPEKTLADMNYDELTDYAMANNLSIDEVVDKAVKMKKGKNEPTSLKDGVDQLEKDSKGFNKFGKQKEAEQPKEKGLNEYTDQLFKESGTKTYTTKKGKNPKGEIVEIRRFGEGQNAIRYNETLGKVEQVWINGKRVV